MDLKHEHRKEFWIGDWSAVQGTCGLGPVCWGRGVTQSQASTLLNKGSLKSCCTEQPCPAVSKTGMRGRGTEHSGRQQKWQAKLAALVASVTLPTELLLGRDGSQQQAQGQQEKRLHIPPKVPFSGIKTFVQQDLILVL